jgi:hypothetical protein
MEIFRRNPTAETPFFPRRFQEIVRMLHSKTGMILCLLAFAGPITFACTGAAHAQTGPKADCEVAAPARSPTATAKGPDSGSKNMGSTGWSGETHSETTEAGPLPGSKSEHPATAKGLDPTTPDSSPRKPC